jgi:hypothetical protein
MKYLCLDDYAINRLISGRQMQSVDFAEGAAFVEQMKGSTGAWRAYDDVIMTARPDGLFLSSGGSWKDKKYLVIDCEESGIFTSLSKADTLTVLQKSFRFCAKFWNGAATFAPTEKMITGTSKTVLFPLGFSQSRFRVVLERDPDAKRLQPRGMQGRFILLYKASFEAGDSETEMAPLGNFRYVFDELANIYRVLPRKIEFAAAQAAVGQGPNLTQTVLEEDSLSTAAGSFLPVQEWLKRLTVPQHLFVYKPHNATQRLIGAAGTGKTATLLIRSIFQCALAERDKRPFRALFVTHSEATRKTCMEILDIMEPEGFHRRDPDISDISLSVKTLAALCTETLNRAISETELIDKDAQDSKELQKMYIEESITRARSGEFKSYAPHLSEQFRIFFEGNNDTSIAALFQHEISVQIKGRAGSNFDAYKKCPPLKYGLPVCNDADRGFVYWIYRNYEDSLRTAGQFDTDDVVISAIGQLDTPIWRRRRGIEGFDFICIDETHLFNVNEIQVFHFLTKQEGTAPISFAVDRAQAVGDRGWSDTFTELDEFFGQAEEEVVYNSVFRSSTDIVNLSTSILSTGATLFSNFKNSLEASSSGLTAQEEKLCQEIVYYDNTDDEAMIERAFKLLPDLQRRTQAAPWEVLITSLTKDIIDAVRAYSQHNNKPVTFLDRRGDFLRVKEAQRSGHIVVGHADFVGGLEFKAVLILGVDKGRVPLEPFSTSMETRSFHKYNAHNQLYVAVSRARFAVALFGLAARGPSDLLVPSIEAKLVTRSESLN